MTYGNGRKLTVDYDQKRQQPTRFQLRKVDGSDPIMDLSYDFYNGGGGSEGNNGRLRRVTDNLRGTFSADFGYDDHHRLTSYGPANQRNYRYDPWGNLTGFSSSTGGGEVPNFSAAYALNSSGAPSSNRISNAGFSYDAAGNMTSDGSLTMAYDAANRLKTASGGGGIYEYNADGDRIRQTNNQGTVYYLWSSLLGQPVVEIASHGAPYVYRAYVCSPTGQVVAFQSYDGGFYWIHSDYLGSGRMLTNTAGSMVYRGEFDPYGQALYEEAAGGATYLNSRKYTGYERDYATNLNNAKARSYNHNFGRFLQPEPLGITVSNLGDPQPSTDTVM